MDVVGGLCLLACSWWVCEPRRTVKWLQNEESVDWWNKRLLESLWGDEIATPEGSICPSGFCFVFFGKHQMTVAIVWEWICWSRWLFRPLELDRAVADGDIVSCTARGYSNYRFVKLRLWLATSPCLALGFIGFHARQIWLFPSSVCRRGRLCFLSIPGIFLISTLLLPTDNPVVSFLCLIRLAHSLFSFTWWTPPVSKGYFPSEIRGMMAITFKSQWREKEE